MASNNLFISWSGDLSKKIALEFNDWLPSVIQAIKPYFSPDMKKGIFWGPEINKQLSELKLGILIMTPDNKDSTWIHYEAGGLISKLEDKDIVCPICFNLKPTDLAQPLGDLNATIFSKDEIYKLLHDLNSSLGDLRLDSKVLNKEFELKWPKFETKVNEILSKWKPSKSTPESRSSDEKIDEILSQVRYLKKIDLLKEFKSINEHRDHYVIEILKGDESRRELFKAELIDHKSILNISFNKVDSSLMRISTREGVGPGFIINMAKENELEIFFR